MLIIYKTKALYFCSYLTDTFQKKNYSRLKMVVILNFAIFKSFLIFK